MRKTVANLPLGPIADAAVREPDGIALVDALSERTWSDVQSDLTAAAAAMLAAAPDPDQRWGVLGDNAAPTLLAHAAGLLAGVGTVAVSRQLTLPELTDQIEDATMVGLVAGPGGAATAVAALEAGLVGIVVLHSGAVSDSTAPGLVAWDDWISAAPTGFDFAPRPARPAMVYTSGTTGRARGTQTRWVLGAVADNREYLDRLRARAQFPEGPHIVVGPLQHNGPLTAVRHLLLGQPVVIVGKFDGAAVLDLIGRYQVTSSVMVPTHFQRLLAVDPAVRAAADVSSVRLIAHTGSACPPDVKRAMIDWFGPVLLESYGGSESGTLCRITSPDWLTHPGSVGTVVEPFRVVVVDEGGEELPLGEVGLLAFEAPEGYGVSYHRDEEKTAKAYVRPGAFTLGDMGYVDADGFVFITDRMSDMVVSGGVNLYPSESEAVLREHPDVADVAVIGVPHADLGEQLLALIVPADPAAPPSGAELQAFCRERLAAYKIPRRYEYTGELPRNEMQKVDKKALRRPYWDSDRTIGG
jgi:acyl-CoA synthetase (AMP-forming)/AMP-acid ligase II